MNVYAFYGRVSTEDQAERGTIENQIEFATKYADLHQFDFSSWYKDDGITGTLPLEDRPDGARLLQDARNGRFNILLIYRLDRLGRTARNILNAIYELEQYGIKVKSMTEPFDTGDPAGRFILTILAGVADLDRSNTLDKLWNGANRWARLGKWLGGIVPYGYFKNDEGYLEINESPLPGCDFSEAGVIRLIYNLLAIDKLSTIKIADYLNSLRIPTSYAINNRKIMRGKRKVNTSGKWSPGRVRNMVVSTTYKGIHHYGKRTKKVREIISRKVPAIVSEAIWEQAQQTLHDNQIEATRNARRQYLLRSLIKCDICGLTYSGTAYKGPGGKPKAYYTCNGKVPHKGPYNGRCGSKNLPALWAEEMIWNDCLSFINNPGIAIDGINNSIDEAKKKAAKVAAEKEMIYKAIQSKDSEKQAILDLFRRRIITAKDVELQLQQISTEAHSLEKRLNELDEQMSESSSIASQCDSAEQLLTELRLKTAGDDHPFEIKRKIVRTLVKGITVHTKNEGHRPQAAVSILYSFSKDVPRTDRDSSKRQA